MTSRRPGLVPLLTLRLLAFIAEAVHEFRRDAGTMWAAGEQRHAIAEFGGKRTRTGGKGFAEQRFTEQGFAEQR